VAHFNLGLALYRLGDPTGAAAAYRKAIRLEPDLALVHHNLGRALSKLGDPTGAAAAYREAIRLKSDYALAHYNLGVTLGGLGDPTGAAAAFREAIRLKPDDVAAHYNLGVALSASGDPTGAAAAYREAVRLRPDDASAHCNLGQVLGRTGRYAESLAEYRRGHELGSKRPDWKNPSADWVREAERLVALEGRLPAILKGDDRPRDTAERLAFAQMGYDTKRYAAAARFWAEAFADDPKSADDPRAGHRYNAACAAARAGCGEGRDDPPPDDVARAGLRARALGWLQADLAAWSKRLASGPPQARDAVRQTLQHWKADPDLAGVREPKALEALPEAERVDWRDLWAEVDRLLGGSVKAP
jgi:tetratricopeptide (TPR) repeat protein